MVNQELQAALNRLRANKTFELFVVAVIIFSALVIGLKTYEVPQSMLQLVTVLDEEHQRERDIEAKAAGEPTIKDLQRQLDEIKSLIMKQNSHTGQ